MFISKESRLLGVLYFVAALVCGVWVFGVSYVSGMASFVILTLTLEYPAPLDYYEIVTLCTYFVYVLIVTALICFATSRSTRLKRVGTFLLGAAAFWAIHGSLPLGAWVPLGLATVAALPIYQILVQHARTRHTNR